MRNRLIATVVVLLSLFITSVHGQSAAYDGLDVLFLVDQSGSMGGRDFGHNDDPKDPLGLRFQAVQYALRTLSEYRRVVPTETVFRMGVISFGDTTEITLPWTNIPENTADVDVLANVLSADSFGARNLGNTNFLAAYREAEQQFLNLPVGENHLRVIIILTDGAPCAPREFTDTSCSTPSDQTRHMEDLVTLGASAFPAPNYRLFAIAIDNRNEFWGRFVSYWNRVVGDPANARRVENSTDIGQSFLEILAEVVNALRPTSTDGGTSDQIGIPVEVINQSATVDVPPYYQAMRITVFKTTPIASIAITDSNGITLNQASPQVTITGVNGAIETWTINNPTPGRWQIVTSLNTNLLDIYLDLIRVSYQVELPPTTFTRYVDFPLTLRLLDVNGESLPNYSDPLYSLDVQATLRTPSGVSTQFALTSMGQNVYLGQLVPEQVGTYTLDVLATTNSIDNSEMIVIDQPEAAVIEVLPLRLEANIEPQNNILISQSVEISARLTNGTDVFSNDNFTLEAEVRGGETNLNFQLTPDETNGYSANVVMDNIGQYQITVRAKRRLENGTDIVIDEQVMPLFQVSAAEFISLRIAQPLNDEQQFTVIGIPPVTPNDLVVEVIATGEDGTPRSLESLTPDASIPLMLSVHDENGDITGSITLSSSDAGVYRAVFAGLGTGTYTITVNADTSVPLSGSTLFDRRYIQQTVTIIRATNPLWIGMLVLIGVVTVGSIAGIAGAVYHNIKVSQHPAVGRLVIYREDYGQFGGERSQVWSMSLDRKKRNYIVERRPPGGLQRIIIECSSDTMRNQKQVLITVEMKGRKIINRQAFRPGTERRLDGISSDTEVYTIAKDPESLEG